MTRQRTLPARWRRILQTTALIACLAPTVGGTQQLIVNADVPEESLALNGVRAIFFMRMAQWPSNGRPIKVFVLEDRAPLHIQFSKNLLDVFPHQLRRSWDRLVFSGTGQAPITVANEDEMRQRVANTPGAIGYVEETKDNENIRHLAVD